MRQLKGQSILVQHRPGGSQLGMASELELSVTQWRIAVEKTQSGLMGNIVELTFVVSLGFASSCFFAFNKSEWKMMAM